MSAESVDNAENCTSCGKFPISATDKFINYNFRHCYTVNDTPGQTQTHNPPTSSIFIGLIGQCLIHWSAKAINFFAISLESLLD